MRNPSQESIDESVRNLNAKAVELERQLAAEKAAREKAERERDKLRSELRDYCEYLQACSNVLDGEPTPSPLPTVASDDYGVLADIVELRRERAELAAAIDFIAATPDGRMDAAELLRSVLITARPERAIRGKGILAAHDAEKDAEIAALSAGLRLAHEQMRGYDIPEILIERTCGLAACERVLAEHDKSLVKALADLVERLDFVHADEHYKSVWYVNQLHSCPYTGPTYTEELEAARAALAQYKERT